MHSNSAIPYLGLFNLKKNYKGIKNNMFKATFWKTISSSKEMEPTEYQYNNEYAYIYIYNRIL